jgi:hypothetical protein
VATERGHVGMEEHATKWLEMFIKEQTVSGGGTSGEECKWLCNRETHEWPIGSTPEAYFLPFVSLTQMWVLCMVKS